MRRSLPILIVLLALAARLIPGPRTIDDSYITFRYARHILAGDGMVYNPGEHVLGTTTPLYASLMAGLGLFIGGVHADFPVLAMIVNAIFDAITCLLLLKLGEKLGSPRAGTGAAFVWAILPFSVTFAIGGLETSLVVLLMTGTVYTHLAGLHTRTAFLAALCLLTRPDALILLGPLALDRLISSGILHPLLPCPLRFRVSTSTSQALGSPQTNHAQPSAQDTIYLPSTQSPKHSIPQAPISLSELLAALVPTLGWVLFATLYYGSPLPHSITAKSVAYLLAPNSALIRLLQHYATPFMDHLTFGVPGIMVGFVLYPFLFLVGARAALKSTARVWAWVVYPWLYFAVFAIANPLIFRWYLTPPLPAYILLILLGLDKITRGLTEKSVRVALRHALPALFVVVLPVYLSMQDWQLRPDHGTERPAPDMAWYQLELLYREAADVLEPDIRALAATRAAPVTLAAGDVGALGYYTSARILDTLGLNSPEAIPYYPVPPEMHANTYAVAPDLILDEWPDFVVLLEVYGREGLFKDPRFLAAYHLRLTIPTDIYESEGMVIYERNGIP